MMPIDALDAIGGPAFPQKLSDEVSAIGLSARDYFAAHAPNVPDLANFPIKQWRQDRIVELDCGKKQVQFVQQTESWATRSARWAMEYADAMLAERAK